MTKRSQLFVRTQDDLLPANRGHDPLPRGTNYFVYLDPSGPTSARPTYSQQGQPFVDTTLNKPIWYYGAAWRDCTGASV
jgi:hypothetical protein